MEKRPAVGVAVIVIKNGKVLLGKRKGAHGSGSWAFPGGHLEFNESIETCAKREVFEETGMTIKNFRFATITNDLFHQSNKHYVTLFVVCDHKHGTPRVKEPDKCEEWAWFYWNEFPKPIFLSLKNLLQQGFSPFCIEDDSPCDPTIMAAVAPWNKRSFPLTFISRQGHCGHNTWTNRSVFRKARLKLCHRHGRRFL